MNIIGREAEKRKIENALKSRDPELLVVYGRRRVGKTYLIREYCKEYIRFEFSGMYKASAREQLRQFSQTLFKYTNVKRKIPTNWIDALWQLQDYCDSLKDRKKKVIFIDEFPWIDNNKSSFLRAFDHFWNRYGNRRGDLMVIICGSAASYMINKIIRDKGGLHNRLTDRIRVEPFNLAECASLLKQNGVKMTKYDMLQVYMAMGGIPHYWQKILPGESAVQAIDRLCFEKDGFLRNEFSNVFASLFDLADNHEKIIRTLANVRKGLTRTELLKRSKLPSGGNITNTLNELEESGFIEHYTPYKGTNYALYRLKDEYSGFYVKYIEKNKPSKDGVWNKLQQQASFKAWAGFTFETICMKHIDQIREALKISGMYSYCGSWIEKNNEQGAQIDLLIDRADNIINIFEIKFYNTTFTIDKKYCEELMRKEWAFRNATKTRKGIFLTFITTFGLVKNEYYLQQVQNSITLDDLFKD
jgi:AAA+ ATPase superfamily predicted ATPase